jgi:hypothetical protein
LKLLELTRDVFAFEFKLSPLKFFIALPRVRRELEVAHFLKVEAPERVHLPFTDVFASKYEKSTNY